MIPPISDDVIRFNQLETLYERRLLLRNISKLYNLGTEIDKEIEKSIELIDDRIKTKLKQINAND